MKHQKRNKQELGLEKGTFSRNKQWMLDQDYSGQLDEETREWLGRFNNEFYGNKFSNNEQDLHNTKELKNKCYNTENARNRDLYSIKNCVDLVVGDCTVNDGEGNEISHLDKIADYNLGYYEVEEKLNNRKK